MNNIAIVNGVDLSEYALEKLKHNLNTLELVYEYGRNLPLVDKVVLFTTPQWANRYAGKIPAFLIETAQDWNQASFLEKVLKWAKGCANIFYFYGDTPYLDLKLTGKMDANHKKYFAEYSFADGYPAGLTPEIISTTIIKRLMQLAPGGALKRDTFFDIIKKDINSFDIETEIAPSDLRMLRVELFADRLRNFLLLQSLSHLDGVESITDALTQKPEILRTLPAYYAIQITRNCPQDCSYCPYPGMPRTDPAFQQIALPDFKTILEKIAGFSQDAVINLSPWGEPGLHPQIKDIIATVLEYSRFQLLIETAGIGWDPALFPEIKQNCSRAPIWIVSLDAAAREMYIKLRGQGYDEAYRTAETLLNLFPDNCYIQAVRMVDNEDDLEQFYNNWKQKTENIIVQKYDRFCAVLPEKRVTDLSPVKRFPCWHIKRDLTILLDGSVPMCREDTRAGVKLGNIFTDSLDAIWKKGNQVYLEHLALNYNTLCAQCDEYYTYNF